MISGINIFEDSLDHTMMILGAFILGALILGALILNVIIKLSPRIKKWYNKLDRGI